jgi:hypothetical protein
MSADCAQHLWAEARLVFAQKAEDAGHATNPAADLDEELRGRAATKLVKVLGTALQAEPIERIEMNHGGGLSAPRDGCQGE